MSADSSREVFLAEFRHEIVAKFARQIAEGSIAIKPNSARGESAAHLAQKWVILLDDINKLFSGKLSPTELDAVEENIFATMIFLRSGGGLVETHDIPSDIENEMAGIKARIDSTNNLLMQTTAILAKLVKLLEQGKDD